MEFDFRVQYLLQSGATVFPALSYSKKTNHCIMRIVTLCCTATLLLLMSSLKSNGQLFVGVEGGPNMNYLTTGNASEPFTTYQGMKGWNIGIPVGYRFFDWLSVMATPTYITKNYDIVRTGFFTGVYQKNYNTYWQL